jgi:hypothetical protein
MASLPHNHPVYAYTPDGLTEQRPGWTPNNALLDELGCLGYSKSHRTVNPVIVPARYNFPYSSSRPPARRQRHDGRRGTGLAEGPLAKGLYYRPDHEWHSRTGSRPARPVNRRASTC